jgi:Ran GTPase-activating protein (RanGAP) involved in mRNA processing and transport
MLNKLIADPSLTRLAEVEIINRNRVIKSIIAATVGLLMSSAPTKAISLLQNTNQPFTVVQATHRSNALGETRDLGILDSHDSHRIASASRRVEHR